MWEGERENNARHLLKTLYYNAKGMEEKNSPENKKYFSFK